jgi:hypothetical protein
LHGPEREKKQCFFNTRKDTRCTLNAISRSLRATDGAACSCWQAY